MSVYMSFDAEQRYLEEVERREQISCSIYQIWLPSIRRTHFDGPEAWPSETTQALAWHRHCQATARNEHAVKTSSSSRQTDLRQDTS